MREFVNHKNHSQTEGVITSATWVYRNCESRPLTLHEVLRVPPPPPRPGPRRVSLPQLVASSRARLSRAPRRHRGKPAQGAESRNAALLWGRCSPNPRSKEPKEDLEPPLEGVFLLRISQNPGGPFPRHQNQALKDLREAWGCAVGRLSRGEEELFGDPR